MKQFELSANKYARYLFANVNEAASAKKIYTSISLLTFFLIITGQLYWSTIHGDGAVYAWIIRKISEGGVLTSKLPYWNQTQVFAEHPYLFFYLSSLFTRLIGFSDFALKIPNFLVATLSIFIVYKTCILRNNSKYEAHQIGLLAGYALILNASFIMQVSQPSLDPLAQLLSLIAVILFLFYRSSFFSGLILGLAFLTKGLELLPNLAALLMLSLYINRANVKNIILNSSFILLGVLVPIFSWLFVDFYVWHSEWITTYWNRQFAWRFFSKDNMQTVLSFAYLLTFAKVYFFEIIILSIGLIKSKKWLRRSDALFVYFVFYLFFNILAFLIIKKNSSQHLTGVLLIGSIFIGEYLWELWNRSRWKLFKLLPVFLFLISFVYWCWFVLNGNKNPDIWTSIKNESEFFIKEESKTPIVIKETDPESYGFFYTTQWYFHTNKVYFQSEADQFLAGQEVYILSNGNEGKLSKTKLIYQRGVF